MAAVKGCLFVGLVLATGILGLHFFIIPVIPAIILYLATSVEFFSKYISKVQSFWMTIISDFLLISGIKMIVSGEDIKRNMFNCGEQERPLVIILNHRTRFDWLFLFAPWNYLGSLGNIRIMLKSPLKHVPIFGTTMQMLGYIFINRKWSEDKDYLLDSLFCYFQRKFPLQLVLFPEGTDLSKTNQKKDAQYTSQYNLTPYQYVLHPRTTGFIQTIQGLGGSSQVDVCDITVGYIGNIPQGEKEIVKGLFPDEIHFHIKHYPSSCLPSTDEELSQWLKMRWDEKEQLLTQFYNTHSFPGPVNKEIQRSKLMMSSVLFMWLAVFIGIIYCCINVPLLMISAFIVPLIIHYVINKLCGGWDKLLLNKYKQNFK